jgi:tRNA A37 methylthiotransferase MiaB
VKEARAKELIGLGKELTDAFLSRQVGTVQEVLLESGGEGYTGNYVRVRCPGREGTIMKTRILSLDGETAIGKEI